MQGSRGGLLLSDQNAATVQRRAESLHRVGRADDQIQRLPSGLRAMLGTRSRRPVAETSVRRRISLQAVATQISPYQCDCDIRC